MPVQVRPAQPRLDISRLLPNPTDDEEQTEAAWIINRGTTAVNLNGWKLKDLAGQTWSLDSLGQLAPGAGCRVPGAGCRVPGAECREEDSAARASDGDE